jgi:hypothetical protein
MGIVVVTLRSGLWRRGMDRPSALGIRDEDGSGGEGASSELEDFWRVFFDVAWRR